jgi:uncharacterized protein YegP (UPF0339 family)
MSYFEIYQAKDGVRVRLIADNGEVVVPTEQHRDTTDAERACADLASAVLGAVRQTGSGLSLDVRHAAS